MKVKDFFFKRYSIFFGLFCVVANIFSVVLANLTDFSMPKDVSMDQWFDFLGAHNTVINLITILCYLVPVLVCILYTAPIVKLRPSDEKYKHIAVHIPAVYALAGILGWVINFLIELIILIYLNVTNGFDIIFIMISSASSMMFLSMVSFTTIFFTLETFNRNLILPRLYP